MSAKHSVQAPALSLDKKSSKRKSRPPHRSSALVNSVSASSHLFPYPADLPSNLYELYDSAVSKGVRSAVRDNMRHYIFLASPLSLQSLSVSPVICVSQINLRHFLSSFPSPLTSHVVRLVDIDQDGIPTFVKRDTPIHPSPAQFRLSNHNSSPTQGQDTQEAL